MQTRSPEREAFAFRMEASPSLNSWCRAISCPAAAARYRQMPSNGRPGQPDAKPASGTIQVPPRSAAAL